MPFPQNKGFTSNTKGYFTPDIVEIVEPLSSRQTEAGYITLMQRGKESYVSTGINFPAYTFLATGRFLATSVNPTEYGDREALDHLMAIVHTMGKTEEEKAMIRPTIVARIYRKGYTPESGKLYRMVTGNPYTEHVEYRLTPIPE